MKQEIQEALSNCLTKTVIEFEGKSKKFASCHHKELTLFILPYGFGFNFKRHLNKTQSNVFKNLYSGFVKRLKKVYYELGGEEICEFPFNMLSTYHVKQCVKNASLPNLITITIDTVKYREYERLLPETDLVRVISRHMNHLKKDIIILSKKHPSESLVLINKLIKETYDALRYYDFEGDELNINLVIPCLEFNRPPSLDTPSKEVYPIKLYDGEGKTFPKINTGETLNSLTILDGDKMIITNKLGTKGVICKIMKDGDTPIKILNLEQLKQKAFHLHWKINTISGARGTVSEVNLDVMNEYAAIRARIRELKKAESNNAGEDFINNVIVVDGDGRSTDDALFDDNTDWDRVLNMSEEEIENNAKSDPDNQPMTDEELDRMIPIKRPSANQMFGLAPESSLNLSHLPEVRGVVLSPEDIKNDEVYFNKQNFFYGQIRIISKYYPEFIFNLVEDFLEALNISKLEKSFDEVKLDEIILNTRIDILSNTLVYIDVAYREKAEDLLTGYISSLEIFLATLSPVIDSNLFEELYSEEI